MKKIVLIVAILIVSVTTMHATAFEPQYHRFLRPEWHNKLSDAEYRLALKGLFEGDKMIESKYWNSIPTCSYDQMRSIYAQHLMIIYKLKELPGPEAMVGLVDISNTVPLPNVVHTAGIVKGTARAENFSRNALPGEKGLEQAGIIWTIESCGNLGNIGSLRTIPVSRTEEEFDRPTMKTEFASNKEGDWDNNPSKSSNTITINTVAPAGTTTGSGMNSEMMMWMAMMAQNQQRAYAPPAEVIVKNKANAWEVIAGVTGIANLGLNIYDLVRGPRVINYGNDYYDGGRMPYRPSRPWRPNYPDNPQYPITPPWQGGSGYYPNPIDYTNTNAGGLGAGNGTIWGSNGTTNGGATYRLPVSPTYQW